MEDKNFFLNYEDYLSFFRHKYPSGIPLSKEDFYRKYKSNGSEGSDHESSQEHNDYYPISLVPETLLSLLEAVPPLPTKEKYPYHPTRDEKPQKPADPQQRRGRYSHAKLSIPISVLIFFLPLNFLLELTLIVLVLLYGLNDATKGYKSRKRKYKEEVFKIQEWNKNKDFLIRQWEENYRERVMEWESKKREIDDCHEQKCQETLMPQNIIEWRLDQIRGNIESSHHFSGSCAKEGRLDSHLREAIIRNFPVMRVEWNQKVVVPQQVKEYTPDVILYDPYSQVWFDIEVDEPWYFNEVKERVPCHYINHKNDDERNRFFQAHNWVVIRFSESQVTNNLNSCIKFIGQELDKFRLENISKIGINFENIPNLHRVPRWTQEEAIKISRNYRHS